MIKLDKIELQLLRDLVQSRLQEAEVIGSVKIEKERINFYDPMPLKRQEEFDLRMILHKLENALND